MMGRAGRPQFDDSAVAVIYVQDSKKTFYKKFLYEPFPVESSLLPVLPNHVNAEISAGTIDSKQGIVEYLSGTYLYRRFFANPNYYGLEEDTEEAMLKFITNIVDGSVKELLTSECIHVNDENDVIKPTAFGRIASVYYLQHETIRFLVKDLHSACTVENMLKILTDVPEYAEIPVRHNEDLINTELQRKLRIRFSTAVMGTSAAKAHLLFQAHFMRTVLPTDYRTDLKSVLDQCIRILQAMREMARFKNWLAATMNIVLLQQMCHSARWHDDHPLLCLPHLSYEDARAIGEQMSIPQLQDYLEVEKAASFEDPKLVKRAMKLLREKTTLDDLQCKEVLKAVCNWPIVSLKTLQLLDEKGNSVSVRDEQEIQVTAGEVYKLRVVMERSGPAKNNSSMYLPQWAKSKQAGWIILVGDTSSDRILNTTSVVGSHSTRTTAKLDVRMPSARGKCRLSIFVLSDCYLGIDQEYTLHLDVC
ncbi:unnamed protein product [Caenorhabditis sp. 36 PRJEB53466]|nr:unnamed protein product [Caenorhabditis sp. 36 PRJEB53466]